MSVRGSIGPAAWTWHAPEYVDLRVHDDGRPIVVMDLVPPDAEALRTGWERLAEMWLDLPPHPGVLDAIERSEQRGLLVRYAAIDWLRKPLPLSDGVAQPRVAVSWGLQISHAMQSVIAAVSERDAGWFACPTVRIDLGNHARLGFLPASPYSPTTRRFLGAEGDRRWPHLEETTVVYMIGRMLADLTAKVVDIRSPVSDVIERCLALRPADRYASLAALRLAMLDVVPSTSPYRSASQCAAWSSFEEGVGWLAVGDVGLALAAFDATPRTPELEPLVSAGIEEAHQRTARPPSPADTGDNELSPYRRGKALMRLGRLPEAREHLERALALEPTRVEAMFLRREIDRQMRDVRTVAGHQYPVHIDLPEALEGLRSVLLSGNAAAAIEALRQSPYDQHATAQLMLARFLVLEHRFEEAIAACDHAAELEASSSRAHDSDSG